jgi:hypothetical protein
MPVPVTVLTATGYGGAGTGGYERCGRTRRRTRFALGAPAVPRVQIRVITDLDEGRAGFYF